MPFVPAAGICEVFIEHNLNDKSGLGWVLHYEKSSGAWGPELFADLGAQLKAWWNTSIKPLVGAHCALTRIRMRDITTANSPIGDYSDGLPIVGTGSGSPPSNNVAWSIKKNSGLAGRSYRGRVYMLGMTESVITGNLIDTGWGLNVIAAFNDALLLVGGDSDYGMVVVSKYSGGSPRVNGLATDVISFSAADYRVDTRRDRL